MPKCEKIAVDRNFHANAADHAVFYVGTSYAPLYRLSGLRKGKEEPRKCRQSGYHGRHWTQ